MIDTKKFGGKAASAADDRLVQELKRSYNILKPMRKAMRQHRGEKTD